MAHIIYRRKNGQPGARQLIINGVDYSNEVYHDVRVVEVGDNADYAEVGFQVTFVVSRLDLDCEADVQLTDNVPAVARRVRSIVEADA